MIKDRIQEPIDQVKAGIQPSSQACDQAMRAMDTVARDAGMRLAHAVHDGHTSVDELMRRFSRTFEATVKLELPEGP